MMVLFPDEDAIAQAVLGPTRARLWKSIAAELEKRGFPRIHPLLGGRYWPSVVAFFDRENGLSSLASDLNTARAQLPAIRDFAPDGAEDHRAPQPPPAFRRRSSHRARRART
jgi:hypothetical protein